MFGKIKEKLLGASTRLSGKTDLLEGIAAAGILVSAADGDMDTSEVGVLIEALVAHEVIGQAFPEHTIQQTVQRMVDKASPNAAGKIGLVGKLALEKEIREVKAKSTTDDIQLLLAIIIDVAGADEDGIEPAERAAINKISTALGQGNAL